MPKNVLLVAGSAAVAVVLIGGALWLRQGHSSGGHQSYSLAELAKFDGRGDHDCLVAVDGQVYKIEQGRLWQNGQHEPSEGQASCGRDLSQVITRSPHGKSKLATLQIVGKLKN